MKQLIEYNIFFCLILFVFACKKELPITVSNPIAEQPPVPPIRYTKQPPVSNAGKYQFFSHPPSEAILNGYGTDTDGYIVSYSWTQLSGPNAATIYDSTKSITTIKNLNYGFYEFQLKVTDNDSLTAIDKVGITIDSSGVDPCYGCWDY